MVHLVSTSYADVWVQARTQTKSVLVFYIKETRELYGAMWVAAGRGGSADCNVVFSATQTLVKAAFMPPQMAAREAELHMSRLAITFIDDFALHIISAFSTFE